ncbi:RNA degradosome polyphosphate kinase [Altererythrobacter sp. SALINAS58]|nr:RNA degradosome polyphosphate kinase [Alteripontixanthobacter muriae]
MRSRRIDTVTNTAQAGVVNERVSSQDHTSPPYGPDCYFNRELSWLAFNRRVLAEACNRDYPLLERLRFLSISGSNLDEFIMVRVAGLAGQVKRGIEEPSVDGMTPLQQMANIRDELDHLEKRQQEIWEDLRDELADNGITLLTREKLAAEPSRWLKAYVRDHILPVITPQAIDPAHPFPFVANQGMGLLFSLTRKSDGLDLIEMILIPPGLPRFVAIPQDLANGKCIFIAVEQMICRYAELLFPGFHLKGHGLFRVLRDSDIEIEEEAEDLVRYFRTAIQRRRRGEVIQLKLETDFDPDAEAVLHEQLDLDHAIVARTHGHIDFSGLADLIDIDAPSLKFEAYNPRYPERIMEHDGDCFAAIREKDIIIQHPYESFEVVVDFLMQAANDPDVVAVKQTLYRAGSQSPIISALIAAAEAGKSVTAVVELKARFDEEQNIQWASQLERAGVQVIYGFVDWKTHAKVSMVIRREGDAYRTYCHFGTGNYHPINARIYTDLSFFTADPAAGRDAARLFNFVTGYVEPNRTELLTFSPTGLREKLYERIEREIANAQESRPAAIWAQMNSLTDRDLIAQLYRASAAGVRINLVVRGICCLKPEVPGLSENISVKSIIGRFLEHSRIFAFANGAAMPHRRAWVAISSADGMSRNLNRRVEVLVPLRNRTVHDQVLEQVMLANLLDTEQSWRLLPDGSYERESTEERSFNLHRYFMNNPSLSGRGGALETGVDVPRLSLPKGSGTDEQP